jgi:RimJ/RimL family protein N-acetyltransferase
MKSYVLQLNKHVPKLFNQLKTEPSILKYFLAPPLTTEADFVRDFYDANFRASSGCIFAVYDKLTSPRVSNAEDDTNYAGVMLLAYASAVNQTTEMGIVIFPAFHRTHVTSNAIGLLLCWLLDPPSKGGLGLRRVTWNTNAKNEGSRRAAERMGFDLEGIARWQMVCQGPTVPIGVDVSELERRNGTSGEAPGRHTAMYAVVWDEWDGKRESVVKAMALRE